MGDFIEVEDRFYWIFELFFGCSSVVKSVPFVDCRGFSVWVLLKKVVFCHWN